MVRKDPVLRSHLYISLLSILILVHVASAAKTATLHIDLVLLRGSSLSLSHHHLLLILLLVADESTWHDDIHWVVVDADTGATRRTLVQQPVLLHPAQSVDRCVPFSLLTRVAEPFCHRVIMIVEDLHFG